MPSFYHNGVMQNLADDSNLLLKMDEAKILTGNLLDLPELEEDLELPEE